MILKKKRVAVLVSGGVDSSLALVLLKEQGFEVVAFYLKIWLEDELSFLGSCPWEEDLGFVRTLCEKLQVPLQIVNMQKEYHLLVVNLMLSQIKRGLTPNPDVFCNSLVKFGAFFDVIGDEFDFVATGHYAKIEKTESNTLLKLSPDLVKDQTYFLSKLTKSQLSRSLFPIGEFSKTKVRELAEAYDLPSKNRKDSQGLCFLGKIKFEDFIRENIGEQVGEIIELESSKVLGQHNGFWFHTIGQRKGLRLSGGPWYVVSKDANKNIIFVSRNYYDENKLRNKLRVTDIHWISGEDPGLSSFDIKLRHGPVFYKCSFQQVGDIADLILLDAQDQGISAGQFVVFYDQSVCLGSAMILEDLNNLSKVILI